jgi:signal transduction histidine kinase
VVLSLADKGRVMTEGQIARAFVAFRSSKPGGAGVGMLIVRRMVEEVHGGPVAITSAPGAGTAVSPTPPLGTRGASR